MINQTITDIFFLKIQLFHLENVEIERFHAFSRFGKVSIAFSNLKSKSAHRNWFDRYDRWWHFYTAIPRLYIRIHFYSVIYCKNWMNKQPFLLGIELIFWFCTLIQELWSNQWVNYSKLNVTVSTCIFSLIRTISINHNFYDLILCILFLLSRVRFRKLKEYFPANKQKVIIKLYHPSIICFWFLHFLIIQHFNASIRIKRYRDDQIEWEESVWCGYGMWGSLNCLIGVSIYLILLRLNVGNGYY